jgi:hypothetical protein
VVAHQRLRWSDGSKRCRVRRWRPLGWPGLRRRGGQGRTQWQRAWWQQQPGRSQRWRRLNGGWRGRRRGEGDSCSTAYNADGACFNGRCAGGATPGCQSGDGCCPWGCAQYDTDCKVFETAAITRGFWASNAEHDAGNPSKFTGFKDGGTYNSFFVSDLTGLTGTVVQGELELTPSIFYGNDERNVVISDVTTAITTLTASGLDPNVSEDLQTGKVYDQGGVMAEGNLEVAFVMQPEAIQDLNVAAGSHFAIGLHITGLSEEQNEGIDFTSSHETANSCDTLSAPAEIAPSWC